MGYERLGLLAPIRSTSACKLMPHESAIRLATSKLGRRCPASTLLTCDADSPVARAVSRILGLGLEFPTHLAYTYVGYKSTPSTFFLLFP